MRKLTWILLMAIFTQLSSGAVWAGSSLATVAIQFQAGAFTEASTQFPPCHDHGGFAHQSDSDVGNSAVTLSDADQAHCNSTCHICCALGMSLMPMTHPAHPLEFILIRSSLPLVSWTYAPELRPPI